MKIVTMFSGGLDSTVLLYHLQEQGHEIKAMGVNYGQRHAKELEAAKKISGDMGVDYEIADLRTINKFLQGSSQTSLNVSVPEGHYADDSMKATVVPNRNMIMLAVAAGWATSLKYDAIAYGAHGGDHPIYPDCRPEFVDVLGRAIVLGGWHKVSLQAPFIHKSKKEIVELGHQYGVPFEETWSCYRGKEIHCGKCGTCVERREAFALAGIKDPTVYL